MCGIIGMSFRRDDKYREREIAKLGNLFTKALVKAQARGSAATSVTLVSRDNKEDTRPKVLTLRSPVAAEEFVNSDKYKQVISKLNNSSLSIIGHTRAVTGSATAKNNYNNHPHIAGPVVGVHNGYVVNDKELWKKYSAFKYMKPRGSCDSEIIFALINHRLQGNLKNTDEAIARAIEEIEGWYAIAVVNMKEPEKVFILRDRVAPLDIVWWGYGKTAMFASNYDYIAGPFEETKLPGTLRRHVLEPMTIVALDSCVKHCNSQDFHVHSRQLRLNVSDVKQAELINNNKEAYNISQGKTQA